MIAVFSVIRFDVTLQRFLFCVLAELVISKMLFCSECFFTQWARNIFFNVDIPVKLSECFLDLNCLPHTLQTKSQIIIVNFGFDPTQVSVSLRLDSKAVKFSYFWWPEQLIKCQTSYRNLWLSVLLWDLGGLKGKIIAQNMGTQMGLIEHIYFVIFCAGCLVGPWAFQWTFFVLFNTILGPFLPLFRP